MKDWEIKKLINSEESIAIMRYLESAIFSDCYVSVKYSLLRIDKLNNEIEEIHVPRRMVSFLMSRLNGFKLVFRLEDGAVWERKSFRDKVKKLFPEWEIDE